MKLDRIKELIQKKEYSKLTKEFMNVDIKTNTINKWQEVWGLPLEPHGCNLAQRLRSKLASFDLYYNGVPHLGLKKFKGVAEMDIPNIVELVNQIQEIAPELRSVYKKISNALY